MKKLAFIGLISLAAVACKKKKCHECHYDKTDGTQVELGQKCGDELENLEKNGTTVDGTHYDVHCHAH